MGVLGPLRANLIPRPLPSPVAFEGERSDVPADTFSPLALQDQGFVPDSRLALRLQRLVGPSTNPTAPFQTVHQAQEAPQEDDWIVSDDPGNPYKMHKPENLIQAARAKGCKTLTIHGVEVKIYGHPTPEELEHIKQSLGRLPPEALRSAREIYMVESIGSLGDGSKIEGFAGLEDHPGAIILARDSFREHPGQQEWDDTLYHEMGHNLDTASGHPSQRPPFGNGRSWSDYGGRNSKEDFAEVHQWVMAHLEGLRSGDPETLLEMAMLQAKDPNFRAKLATLMELYGWHAPADGGGHKGPPRPGGGLPR